MAFTNTRQYSPNQVRNAFQQIECRARRNDWEAGETSAKMLGMCSTVMLSAMSIRTNNNLVHEEEEMELNFTTSGVGECLLEDVEPVEGSVAGTLNATIGWADQYKQGEEEKS